MLIGTELVRAASTVVLIIHVLHVDLVLVVLLEPTSPLLHRSIIIGHRLLATCTVTQESTLLRRLRALSQPILKALIHHSLLRLIIDLDARDYVLNLCVALESGPQVATVLTHVHDIAMRGRLLLE